MGFATATRHRGGDPDEPGPEANGFLVAISGELLPTLAAGEGPLLWTHGPFVAAPDLVGVEGFVGGRGLGPGHPPEDRRSFGPCLSGQGVVGFSTTRQLTRISHQGHGLRGAVGPAGKQSRAIRCWESGKRLDAPCRADSAIKSVAPALGFNWRQQGFGAYEALLCYWDSIDTGDRALAEKAVRYNEDDCLAMWHVDQKLTGGG